MDLTAELQKYAREAAAQEGGLDLADSASAGTAIRSGNATNADETAREHLHRSADLFLPAASPVIIRAAEILSQLRAFDDMLCSVFDAYVDYHAPIRMKAKRGGEIDRNRQLHLSGYGMASVSAALAPAMTAAQRSKLDAENTAFLAEAGRNLQDLRRLINFQHKQGLSAASGPQASSKSYSSATSRLHYEEVCAYLAGGVAALTKRVQGMCRLQAALFRGVASSSGGSGSDSGSGGAINAAFSFYGDGNGGEAWLADVPGKSNWGDGTEAGAGGAGIRDLGATHDRLRPAVEHSEETKEEGKDDKLGFDKGKDKGKGRGRDSKLGSDFVRRFEGQICSAETLRQYDSLAAQHKTSLLREAHLLHDRYSEDLLQAREMERSVNQVSTLLTEFATLLASQSETVHTVNEEAKVATSAVLASAGELQTTAERSETHGMSLAYLGFGLALLLLLLDFITP
jgi:hypothetical protein